MPAWPQEGYHTRLKPFDEERFEYEVTEGPRKQHVPPPAGDGWIELDWDRGDFTDTALWCRARHVAAPRRRIKSLLEVLVRGRESSDPAFRDPLTDHRNPG